MARSHALATMRRMLRVTGGTWRGRNLVTPPGDETRPAMDFHRANVFNILGQDLTGQRVLDLFAGSGAYGIESLSRGAASVVFVELGSPALAAIRKNVTGLALAPGVAEIVAADCYDPKTLDTGPLALRGDGFDIVFIAPPYPHFRDDRPQVDRLIASLAGAGALLAPDGIAVVQSDAGDFVMPDAPGLAETKRRRYGRTEFTFVERVSSAR